jgi:hypothetical protein
MLRNMEPIAGFGKLHEARPDPGNACNAIIRRVQTLRATASSKQVLTPMGAVARNSYCLVESDPPREFPVLYSRKTSLASEFIFAGDGL